jgi:hypothetical protein
VFVCVFVCEFVFVCVFVFVCDCVCVCVWVCVCLCVFYRTKHGSIVLELGLREIFGLKTDGVAGG